MRFTNQAYRYRGKVLRSRFECTVAYLLELCGQSDWEYEPYVHSMNRIQYRPDFWVPSLRMWVEPRGYQDSSGENRIGIFGDDIARGLIAHRNEVRNIHQLSIVHDPAAPAWQYHQYLVIRGSDAAPTTFTFYRSQRAVAGGEGLVSGPYRGIDRVYCATLNRWSLTPPGEAAQCRMCGADAHSQAEAVVGLPAREMFIRSTPLKYVDPVRSPFLMEALPYGER
jgi:hypothetical protein